MRLRFLFILVSLLFVSLLKAQNESDSLSEMTKDQQRSIEGLFDKAWGTDNKPKQNGKLNLEHDQRLNKLIDAYRDQKKCIGYRIQIYSGRSRSEAIKEKSNFHSKYGESEVAYLIYQSPNFKIRVGNYRDRLQSTKYLEIYRIDFPSAFLVKDEIVVSDK